MVRPPSPTRRIVRFSVFELDVHSGELRKAGVRLNVQDQPLQILKLLLERPGELVTREELRQKLWPADTFVSFEPGLNAAVARLRETLGDSADTPRFVETLPRRGYRFIGAVADDATDNARLTGQFDTGDPHAEHLRRLTARVTRYRVLSAIAVVLCGAVLCAGGLLLVRYKEKQPPTFQRLTFRRGGVMGARFTPDGRTVVYGAAWDGEPVRVYATRIEGPESYAIPLPPADVASISSSAELFVVLNRKYLPGPGTGMLARVPLAGGTPREVADGVRTADWSQRHQQLAISRTVAGRSRIEYPIGTVLHESVRAWGQRISPDGERVAFYTQDILGVDNITVAVADRSGTTTRLSTGWRWAGGNVVWSRKGDEVWFSAAKTSGSGRSELYAVSLSGRERRVLSQPGWLILEDISLNGSVLIAAEHARGGIWCQFAGQSGERDLSWFDNSMVVDLSPDGKTLLVAEMGDSAPATATYLRDTDGSAPKRLGEGAPLALSPDRKWVVAFDEKAAQFLALPIGPGEPKRLYRSGVNRGDASWFPDSKRVLLAWEGKGYVYRTYALDLVGGAPQPITPEGFRCESLSSDGKSAYCETTEGRRIYSLERGQASPIPGLEPNDVVLQWGGDSQSLFIRVLGEFPIRVYRLNVSTGRREFLREIVSDRAGLFEDAYSVRLTMDGRSCCYTMFHAFHDLYLVEGLR
jgi:DNA-binding winged helix-turn-helix (wHTH) protein/Tol biopolymer transport system component